ncbi:hypothetical protein BJX64DRAFT_284141 [Aspergillus heterothallicus]
MVFKLVALLAAGLSVNAFPSDVSGLRSHHHSAPTRTQDACSKLSQHYMEEIAKNVTNPVFPGQLAVECLHALPLDQDKALHMLTELNKYLQWQSTIEILKSNTYLSPAVDLLTGMERIYHEIISGIIKSQYDFGIAVDGLWASANDGHLTLGLCSQSIFRFKSDVPLVSISEDGIELPRIYAYEDAKLLSKTPGLVSSIVSINGQNPTEYLENIAASHGLQDPDARYNQMLPHLSRGVWIDPKITIDYFTLSASWLYQAPHYRFRFQNGTVREVPIAATFYGEGGFYFENSHGLWKELCLPQVELAAPDYYPEAVVRDVYNLLFGYFLEDEGLDDVAVLFVPSFDAVQSGEALAFSQHLTSFLESCVAAGKKRLIFDLQENGGGHTNNGYDLIQALFPGHFMYTSARLRDNEALRLLFKAFQNVTVDSSLYESVSHLFSPPCFLKPDQKTHFTSWEELYGPYPLLGTNLTAAHAIFNYNLASAYDSPIRGYGPVKNNHTTAPFAVENILVITGGACSSTCAITQSLLHWMGVKTVTFGGRPRYGPMAAVGGTSGAQAYDLTFFNAFAENVPTILAGAVASGTPLLTHEEAVRLNATHPAPSSELLLRLRDLNVNLKNAYHRDNDELPLQFQYQPADCRLFFTMENVVNPASVWTSAAKAVWGQGGCVQGSTSA